MKNKSNDFNKIMGGESQKVKTTTVSKLDRWNKPKRRTIRMRPKR